MRRYRCTCGWTGGELLTHPRQGFGVCPRCWSFGTERSPERMFKVLRPSGLRHDSNVPYWLPWKFIESWRAQAERNHGQTLERLDERGGLSPAELWCAAHAKYLSAIAEEIDDTRALPWLLGISELLP